MTNASTNWLLVDTNILVYPYDTRDARKQSVARTLLNRLEQANRGAVSVQILGEFFNALTRKIARPLDGTAAQRRVVNIAQSFRVLDLTSDTVLDAIGASNRNQMSYWDALVFATAKSNGISTIVTEDVQSSGVVEGVGYINPFDPSFDLASL